MCFCGAGIFSDYLKLLSIRAGKNGAVLRASKSEEVQQRMVQIRHLTVGCGVGTKSLEDRVNVVFSPRMVKSLGRCDLKSKTIKFNSTLKQRRGEILLEGLCHETAHIAVHEIHGVGSSLHGEEWRRYIRQAPIGCFTWLNC